MNKPLLTKKPFNEYKNSFENIPMDDIIYHNLNRCDLCKKGHDDIYISIERDDLTNEEKPILQVCKKCHDWLKAYFKRKC